MVKLTGRYKRIKGGEDVGEGYRGLWVRMDEWRCGRRGVRVRGRGDGGWECECEGAVMLGG